VDAVEVADGEGGATGGVEASQLLAGEFAHGNRIWAQGRMGIWAETGSA
jgi:hypothetical protein